MIGRLVMQVQINSACTRSSKDGAGETNVPSNLDKIGNAVMLIGVP